MSDPTGSDLSTADGSGSPPRPRRRDTSPARRRRQRARGGDGDPRDAPLDDAPLDDAPYGEAPERDGPDHRAPDRDGRDRPGSSSGEGPGAGRRRRSGRRAAESRRRRRQARVRTVLGIAVLLLVAVVAIVVASLGLDRARELVGAPADDAAPPPTIAAGDRQPALAFVTHDESGGGAASAVAVLAYDRDADQGTILLVPAGTVADVPGHGSFTVGDAFTFGEGPLVAVTIDNLLDVRLDGVVSVSRDDWAALIDDVGPVAVEVRSRLVAAGDGGGEVRFEPGVQQLDGQRAAEYLTFRGDGETELEALPRTQQVLTGLLARVAEDPDALRDAMGIAPEALDAATAGTSTTGEQDAAADGQDAAAGGQDGAAGEDPDVGPLRTADPLLAYALLTELADARQRERVTTLTLPVSPLGTGRDDLYRVDASRATQLIDERLAASRPTEATGAGRSLQVLNGNGVPGIGQQVAERLQPGGYRILLTGNADRFTHETTRIVVYDDSSEQLAIARDIQERLGVGEIERSGTPQSVVDVTIVVGRDFPPAG